jgi:ABC-type microcin C transport system duplicated ATPase subunit YejF
MTIISPKSRIIKKIAMLQRLYIHNFRCLENFELNLKDMPSALLIGKNGAGKSTIASALEIFQSIGRDINKVKQLVTPNDFFAGQSKVPMRFEIEVLLNNKLYKYILALELPETVKDLRVFEEELLVSGELIYSRAAHEMDLYAHEVTVGVDWRVVALPIIQEPSKDEPLLIFKTCLSILISKQSLTILGNCGI